MNFHEFHEAVEEMALDAVGVDLIMVKDANTGALYSIKSLTYEFSEDMSLGTVWVDVEEY